MVKAQVVVARFTMEVAPPRVVPTTRRRTAAPARSLDPIAEDDREHLAYWSEYHQAAGDDIAAAPGTKTKRAPPQATITGGEPITMRDLGNGKHLPGGHGQRGRRASSRKLQGHRRVV
ncbi:unnamed protein product [Urochloa humidicola]